jgi:hypothetical protein
VTPPPTPPTVNVFGIGNGTGASASCSANQHLTYPPIGGVVFAAITTNTVFVGNFTVTDNCGNLFVPLASTYFGTTHFNCQLHAALITSSTPTTPGADYQVTWIRGGGAGGADCAFAGYQSAPFLSIDGAAVANQGTGTVASPGSVPVTGLRDMVCGILVWVSTVFSTPPPTAAPGYRLDVTIGASAAGGIQFAWESSPFTSSASTPSWTLPASTQWFAHGVALKS